MGSDTRLMIEQRQYPPIQVRLFFGDGEYDFKLTLQGIAAIQAKTKAGIGQIYVRVVSGAYYSDDLVETVRHGLIGGGMSPKAANDLITHYGDAMPLDEWQEVAAEVLTAAVHGYSSEGDGEAAEKKS